MGAREAILSRSERLAPVTEELSSVFLRKLSDFSNSFRFFSKAANCAARISSVAGGMTDPTGGAAGIGM
jgi:hypothetical protein